MSCFKNFNLLKLLYSWKWWQYCNKCVIISNRICGRPNTRVMHHTIQVWSLDRNEMKLIRETNHHPFVGSWRPHQTHQPANMRVIAMIIICSFSTSYHKHESYDNLEESRHKPQLESEYPVVQCNKSLAPHRHFVSVNWHTTSWRTPSQKHNNN